MVEALGVVQYIHLNFLVSADERETLIHTLLDCFFFPSLLLPRKDDKTKESKTHRKLLQER